MSQTPKIHQTKSDPQKITLSLEGDYEVDHWFDLKILLAPIPTLDVKHITFDFKNMGIMDTFGAWQLAHLCVDLEKAGKKINLQNAKPALLETIKELRTFSIPPALCENVNKTRDTLITAIGETTLNAYPQFKRMVSFLGNIVLALGDCLRHPSEFRVKSFIKYLEYTGLRALPIIGLVSLLIGIVLVYQGVTQLERFGAEIFTVNLLAISILRELGILMTAIVVAGRSGSAFTAQIGYMKLNREIDAMKVLGISPLKLLVVPRVIALMVTLPLLTVFSDLVALTGGAFMSMKLIDLSWSQFLLQLQSAIKPATFWVGVVKAPVFAFVIALIGCYEGFRVEGGAESVGVRTTKSVVKSISLVIVLNAIFSVIFSMLKI